MDSGWQILFGVIGLLVTGLYYLRTVANSKLSTFTAVAMLEKELDEETIKFHGIELSELEAVPISVKELGYLAASFTSGRIYHTTWRPDATEPFPFNTYRYKMIEAKRTREVWHLLRKLMSEDSYWEKLENTKRVVEEKEEAAARQKKTG